MSEEAEKNWFKPWLSVQNALLFLTICFITALFDFNKSELASWVQALGSIASIWGALYVSNSQHRRQIAAQKVEATNKAKARLAVVENAAEHALALAEFAGKKPAVFVFIATWKMTLDVTTSAALRALEALPSHELGTYELVLAYSGLLGSLVNIRAEANKFVDSGEHSGDNALAAYEAIQIHGRLTEIYWLQLKSSFTKEFEVFEDSLPKLS